MKPPTAPPSRFWLLTTTAAALVVLAWVLTIPPPAPLPPQVKDPPLPVVLTRLHDNGGDGSLREQVALFDPTPLFLPTEWNAGQQAFPETVRREAGTLFQPLPPKFLYGESELELGFPPIQPRLQSPAEALAVGAPRNLSLGLGRVDRPAQPLSARLAFLSVAEAGSGRVVLTQALPPVADGPGGDWAPLEFLAAVDAAGLIGNLSLVSVAQSDEVAAYFRQYLAGPRRLGQRLAPGFYRISLGP